MQEAVRIFLQGKNINLSKVRFYIGLLGATLLLCYSCNNPSKNPFTNSPKNNAYYASNQNDSCNEKEWVFDTFQIFMVPDSLSPYYSDSPFLKKQPHFDKSALPVKIVNGKEFYDPVTMAQYCLFQLENFRISRKDSILNEMKFLANSIYLKGTAVDSALLFPYNYDFNLHRNENQKMVAPWFSAMAQGQLLSVYSRMFKITGDSVYLDVAHKIFNSFLIIKFNNQQRWISCIDKNKNIWFEEYPMDVPNFTLNGKIFAIYGLYDYYLLTQKKSAKNLLMGGITTIKQNITKFRCENQLSYYCMKHKVQSEGYHNIHIKQLETLFNITGDSVFLNMSNQFKQDFHKK